MSIKLFADKYIELNVQEIFEMTGETRFQRQENETYTFLFCRHGKMEVSFKKNEYILEENDIILIPLKTFFSVKEGNYFAIAISFGGVSCEELLACTEFNNYNPIIHDSEARIGYYFYKTYHAYHEKEMLTIKCLGLFYELFYELTKNYQNIEHTTNLQERHIEIAKEFINQNYASEITIVDVAKKVGVTSNYLANIFNVYVKKSPKIYLTQIRMEQAKKMLATHKYKIKDVGRFVGYKNQLHFSSEFKKYTGKSPLQYAKEINN